MKNKIIGVTGGNGFIGRHVVREALDRGYKVIIFGRHFDKFVNLEKNLECFLGDVTNFRSVNDFVQKCNYVINLAGLLGTQELVNNPISAIETNTIGCLNFLKALVTNKFLDVKGVEITTGNHWMFNPYAISKEAAERFCFMYNKEFKTRVALVRGYNAYGCWQKHAPIRKIIPYFIVKALRGEDIGVYGNGKQICDLIHVKDLASILVDAVVKDHGVYNKTFEAGSGIKLTVKDVAELIIRLTGSKSKLEYLPLRPGEEKDAVVLANTETLKPLGERKFIDLEVGMKETIEWYKKNYNWENL